MFVKNTEFEDFSKRLEEERRLYEETVKDVQWEWLECNHKLVKCHPSFPRKPKNSMDGPKEDCTSG